MCKIYGSVVCRNCVQVSVFTWDTQVSCCIVLWRMAGMTLYSVPCDSGAEWVCRRMSSAVSVLYHEGGGMSCPWWRAVCSLISCPSPTQTSPSCVQSHSQLCRWARWLLPPLAPMLFPQQTTAEQMALSFTVLVLLKSTTNSLVLLMFQMSSIEFAWVK